MSFLQNLIVKFLFLSLSFIPSLILYLFIEPYQRGFYCDDESIRKPKLDHERVPTVALILLVTIPPLLIISIVNWFSHNYHTCRDLQHSFIKLIFSDLFNYLFGCGLLLIILDTTKYACGRHRPNFYQSCEPRLVFYDTNKVRSEIDCSVSKIKYNYITNYVCTKKDVDKDIHLSFMSGHSAGSAYCAVFLSIFLIQRLKKLLKTQLGRAFIALIIVFQIDLACYVGYTRIGDYKHHPTDVLAGLSFGTMMAFFARYFIDRSKCSVYDSDRIHDIQINFNKRGNKSTMNVMGEMV